MSRRFYLATRQWLCAFGAVALLAGCGGHPPAAARIGSLPDRVELTGVPFYRGEAQASAPMALAAALNQQRVNVTPGLVDESVKLPQEPSKLGAAVEQGAREYGMIVYPVGPDLPALLTQVAAGNPVLLRFQEGSSFWAEPRYGLLVGYDRFKSSVLLRAGQERRKRMEFKTFEAAWKGAGSWAVLVLSPNRLPAQVDPAAWRKAADALSRQGQEQAAALATRTLDKR